MNLLFESTYSLELVNNSDDNIQKQAYSNKKI